MAKLVRAKCECMKKVTMGMHSLINVAVCKCDTLVLLHSKGISDFKSDYTTMKSSLCRFQKCKRNNIVTCGTFSHSLSHMKFKLEF